MIALACLWAATAVAAPTERDLGWVSVELDPLTTPLGARNLLVYVEPPMVPHLSVSAIAFASDFPTWIDDMMGYRNRGEAFDVQVLISPGMTVDWFFAEQRQGWHTGLMSFYWRYRAERGGDQARFDNLVVMPRVGHRWFPFERLPIYLDPFMGVMFETRVAGDNRLDGGVVRPSPVLPFATMHLGVHL